MKQEELTKSFMMILSWKNPLFYMVYTNIFQRYNGYGDNSVETFSVFLFLLQTRIEHSKENVP